METGDLVNEFSSSSIVEDDLNGIFNGLEPLEDPKDDMFFFGGKDLLQKVREKNPNDTPAHKPNLPSKPLPPPPLPVLQEATIAQPVPAASCPPPLPQPISASSLRSSNGMAMENKSNSSNSMATASASAMYLDNYLATSGASAGYAVNPVSVMPYAGPPPPRARLERPRMPSKHTSALKKAQLKSAIKTLNARVHGSQLSRSSGTIPNTILNNIAPPLSVSADQITAPLYASNCNLSNPSAPIYTNPPSSPSTTRPSTPNSAAYHAGSYSKRSSPLKNSTSELKKNKILYNPNILLNPTDHNPTSNNLSSSGTIAVEATTTNTSTSTSTSTTTTTTTSTSTSYEPASTTSTSTQGNLQERNTALSNSQQVNAKAERRHSHPHLPNLVSFYGYPTAGMPNIYVPHPFYNNLANTIPEAGYPQRPADSNTVPFDPPSVPLHPASNPNNLYSNLYLYSFNNNNNNNNIANSNSGVVYSNTNINPRGQHGDGNQAYNIYNYNNLYNTYANSNTGYIKSNTSFAYPHPQPRHGFAYDDGNYDDPDYTEYRESRGHSKLKRSKRMNSDDDDDLRKQSRKGKRRSKRSKSPLVTYADVPEYDELKSSHELAAAIPKTEPSPPPYSPPVSLASAKPKTKPSTNLFENTPKIKIGEVQGNAKISKLGKKLLEVMNLDWRSPFTQDSSMHNSPRQDASASDTNFVDDIVNNSPEPAAYTPVLPNSEGSSNASTPLLEQKVSAFTDYDSVPERKAEIVYFVANNIEALMSVSTKIEISLNDFKSSMLGTKIRQRLEVLNTIKTALQLGLIQESQFNEKQKQFLNAFTFGLEKPRTEPAVV